MAVTQSCGASPSVHLTGRDGVMEVTERHGEYYRVADPAWEKPLAGSHSIGGGGRWHGAGIPVAHLDSNIGCARARARHFLFERLKDTDEQSKLNFRFVLGLILMRKRLVIYDGTRHDEGRDVWLVRLKGKPEPMDLLDPKLDEQQMAEVSQQLGQILNEEL